MSTVTAEVPDRLSLKQVRANCLECSGGNAKYVTWCPCDGLHSTRCRMWPYRFGKTPKAFMANHGPRLLTPELMPSAAVNLDDLPPTWDQAATSEINLPGYHQPKVVVERPEPKRSLSEEERREIGERLRRARQKPR